jgi:diguanylate cyclase (GGDEF)-like protein
LPLPALHHAATDTARRGSLALVRLRLRLALLTMAIVPVVISMALVNAVIESQGLDARSRATGDSATISAALASQIQRAEGMLLILGSDRGFDRALVEPVSIDRAREGLRTLATASGNLVPEARLSDDKGAIRLRMVDGSVSVPAARAAEDPTLLRSTMGLPAGGILRTKSFRSPEGDMRFTLAAPVASEGRPAVADGMLALEISLPALMRSMGSAFGEGGAIALVVDRQNGEVIADSRTLTSAVATGPEGPPNLLEALRTTAQSGTDLWSQLLSEGWAVGSAQVPSSASGAPWSIVVLQPTTPPSFPLELVLALGAMAIVVVVLAVWMSQQILRPAEQLETSRRELKQMYEAARADSLHDALTGLGNHRAFQEELNRQIEWYKRYKVPVSLLLIDLDELKVVNDSEGHAAGDEQLQRMGQLISKVVRFSDRAFRIGGDEFAILMPHTDPEGAMHLSRRLSKAASRYERPLPFSGGISTCPDLAKTRQDLYAQADAALYWCKRHGRGSIDTFQPERDRPAHTPAGEDQLAAIVRVIAERQLRAVYQPIVDLRTGVVLGYEGLTRPTEGAPFSNPGQMFEAADEVGHTVELDAACFDIVVATAARTIPRDKLVSVNLSPRTLEAPEFSVANLMAVLGAHGMEPGRLIVELTERENVLDIQTLRHNLAELRAAGIRVAADDVGAGNAGLRLLSQFRFDIVKLDLSLVQDGAQRDSSQAVLRSLRDLAGRWGAFVIAEGLETREQLTMVRELGMSAGQGYLLGRPGTNVELARLDLDDLEAGMLHMQNAAGPARGSAAALEAAEAASSASGPVLPLVGPPVTAPVAPPVKPSVAASATGIAVVTGNAAVTGSVAVADPADDAPAGEPSSNGRSKKKALGPAA